jgi:hypothetical protein
LHPTTRALRDNGHSRLDAADLRALIAQEERGLAALAPAWNALPPDPHLRDGGRYRSRRHSCFVQELQPASLTQVPHRAHWQPTTYNALHGGLERWFEPIEPAVASSATLGRVIAGLGELFAGLRPVARWYIEAHQFRIDTASGIGRPTPEGAHRDGVDYIGIVLVARHGVTGGETRVFRADASEGVRFTLAEPWSALLLDDARVVHETTPIQSAGAEPGWRDTLVVTYRESGFQSPHEQ